ncbi:MAG TPA: zinc ribbon domain-containing protein [Solirubrobacteraceae bacterium]|nr:zinc ribbon domain-containing protein [Solirubrobacteraceae bacterium]
MPLYDFRCRQCGERFEELVPVQELPACPRCGSPEPERLLGSFAGPFGVGLRGAAARRSNATRAAREERRQEGFAKQREERRERGES